MAFGLLHVRVGVVPWTTPAPVPVLHGGLSH
jgi:hypothetical protein